MSENYICSGCKQPVYRTEILDYLNEVNNPDLEPLVISELTSRSL